jgi:hypothetical protein
MLTAMLCVTCGLVQGTVTVGWREFKRLVYLHQWGMRIVDQDASYLPAGHLPLVTHQCRRGQTGQVQ